MHIKLPRFRTKWFAFGEGRTLIMKSKSDNAIAPVLVLLDTKKKHVVGPTKPINLWLDGYVNWAGKLNRPCTALIFKDADAIDRLIDELYQLRDDHFPEADEPEEEELPDVFCKTDGFQVEMITIKHGDRTFNMLPGDTLTLNVREDERTRIDLVKLEHNEDGTLSLKVEKP